MNLFSRFESSFLRRRPLLLGPVLLAIPLVSFVPLAAEDEDITSFDPSTEIEAPEPGTNNESSETADSTLPGETGRTGMLVFVDPETGELTEPTPEQEARMSDRIAAPGPLGLNKSSLGLVPFPLEDGGRGVFLQKRFRSALRVQVLDDGSYEIRCSDHPDQPADHVHDAETLTAEPATEPAPES